MQEVGRGNSLYKVLLVYKIFKMLNHEIYITVSQCIKMGHNSNITNLMVVCHKYITFIN